MVMSDAKKRKLIGEFREWVQSSETEDTLVEDVFFLVATISLFELYARQDGEVADNLLAAMVQSARDGVASILH